MSDVNLDGKVEAFKQLVWNKWTDGEYNIDEVVEDYSNDYFVDPDELRTYLRRRIKAGDVAAALRTLKATFDHVI